MDEEMNPYEVEVDNPPLFQIEADKNETGLATNIIA